MEVSSCKIGGFLDFVLAETNKLKLRCNINTDGKHNGVTRAYTTLRADNGALKGEVVEYGEIPDVSIEFSKKTDRTFLSNGMGESVDTEKKVSKEIKSRGGECVITKPSESVQQQKRYNGKYGQVDIENQESEKVGKEISLAEAGSFEIKTGKKVISTEGGDVGIRYSENWNTKTKFNEVGGKKTNTGEKVVNIIKSSEGEGVEIKCAGKAREIVKLHRIWSCKKASVKGVGEALGAGEIPFGGVFTIEDVEESSVEVRTLKDVPDEKEPHEGEDKGLVKYRKNRLLSSNEDDEGFADDESDEKDKSLHEYKIDTFANENEARLLKKKIRRTSQRKVLRLDIQEQEHKSLYLTGHEKTNIKNMFKNLRSAVFVSNCEATLFYSKDLFCEYPWRRWHSGVPVLVLNTGLHTDSLWLYLADRSTGFPLWRDKIHSCDNFSEQTPNFLEWLLSWNPTINVGLSFTVEGSASDLRKRIVYLASAGSRPNTLEQPRKPPGSEPTKKSPIANPRHCFTHLTSLRSEQHLVIRTARLLARDATSIIFNENEE